MTKSCFFSLTVALLACTLGCGSGDSEGGSGITEAELKKVMEAPPDGPANHVLEVPAEELVQLLTYGMSSGPAKTSLAGNKRRLLGKVLELSPAESDVPFVVLDGGTQAGKAYKVKCIFVADQRESLKELKVGDEIRIDGTSDAVIKDVTLEFKDCRMASEDDASPAPAASKEKKADSKP